MLRKYGHQRALIIDATKSAWRRLRLPRCPRARRGAPDAVRSAGAGVVWCKFTLSVVCVMTEEDGIGLPVAYMVHKYEDKALFTRWLDHLAVFASNSPRHAAWPAPMPPGFTDRRVRRTPARAGASASPAPSPAPAASPAPSDADAWAGMAAGFRALAAGSPVPEAAATARTTAVRLSAQKALAAAPDVVPDGGVYAFCPAIIGIDCSATETPGIEECLWYKGYQGYGLQLARFHARVAWCSWHLDQAWERRLKELCKDTTARGYLRAALKLLRDEEVR